MKLLLLLKAGLPAAISAASWMIPAGPIAAHAQPLAEALDTTNLTWTTGGDAPWSIQTTNTHDGVDAILSGTLGSNQTSWIETMVVGPATISFWVGRSPGYASWYLSVNGGYPGAYLMLPFPPGGWYQDIRDLGEGTNVLRWTVRDYYGTSSGASLVLDEVTVGPARPLAIRSQPYDETVNSGEWASLHVSAVGTPPLCFRWQKEGTNVLGATNSWLWFENATTNDSGIYSVVVSNAQGFVVSSNAVLTVLPPSAPHFTYEPASATLYSGQGLTWWTAVSGSPPFAYQWRKDGTGLPGETNTQLVLTNLSLADAGSYSVVVTNAWGSVESSNAVLTVLPSVAPVITRQPRSLEVAAGVSTWFSVEAGGEPDPSYSWVKVGTNPPAPPANSNPSISQPINPGSPTLSLPKVSTSDAGVYQVTVANIAGQAVSREALLTVLPPLKRVGSWWQGAEDLFVTNSLTFLAQGQGGLAILDVSNPAFPLMVGGYNTPGSAMAVHVADGLAFVADWDAGLQIISITNLSAPTRVGGYNTLGLAHDVVVRGNLAFVADGDAGLLILNISNPAVPAVISRYSTNMSAHRVGLAGDLACVGAPLLPTPITPASLSEPRMIGGLLLINVSNPTHPIEVGRVSTPIWDLDARDGLIFAAVDSGVQAINVADPAQPIVVGTFRHPMVWEPPLTPRRPADSHRIRVVNDLAYVTTTETNLVVLNVGDLRAPVSAGSFPGVGFDGGLWVEGNRVYICGGDSPLVIIDTPFNTLPSMPPSLTLSKLDGMKLRCRGRRGLHYVVEFANEVTGSPWQPVNTIMLTNETAEISVPAPADTGFFRLRQVD